MYGSWFINYTLRCFTELINLGWDITQRVKKTTPEQAILPHVVFVFSDMWLVESQWVTYLTTGDLLKPRWIYKIKTYNGLASAYMVDRSLHDFSWFLSNVPVINCTHTYGSRSTKTCHQRQSQKKHPSIKRKFLNVTKQSTVQGNTKCNARLK